VNLATSITVFLASLAGSVHCAAMCGGFVAAYASGEDERPLARATAHLAYNGGRLVTYLGLGAVAGTVGRALDLAGSAVGIAHVAAVATAVALLVSGIVALVPKTALVRLGRGPSRGLASRLTPLFQRFRGKPPRVRALVLGLSSTLLPCGWLYAFAALAASTGGAFDGAWLMAAFWLGSLPVMLGVGVSLQTIFRRFARPLARLRPVLVIGVGAIALLSRLQLPAFAAGSSGAMPAASAPPNADDCPCHRARGASPELLEGFTPQSSAGAVP
jgi:sulfite exporter TauE/SafE